MNETDRISTSDDPIGSPTTPRTGRGPEQGRGGPSGNPSGPRDANDPGSTRYGHVSGSGRNEPPGHEAKDAAGFRPRHGGDQTADTTEETDR